MIEGRIPDDDEIILPDESFKDESLVFGTGKVEVKTSEWVNIKPGSRKTQTTREVLLVIDPKIGFAAERWIVDSYHYQDYQVPAKLFKAVSLEGDILAGVAKSRAAEIRHIPPPIKFRPPSFYYRLFWGGRLYEGVSISYKPAVPQKPDSQGVLITRAYQLKFNEKTLEELLAVNYQLIVGDVMNKEYKIITFTSLPQSN